MERMNKRAILFLTCILIVCITFGVAMMRLVEYSFTHVTNSGAIKTVGVSTWRDSSATNPLTHINWGVVEPNETVDFTGYIKSESNTVANLSMYTDNWVPLNASTYLNCTWNIEGAMINPNEILQMNLTLAVAPNITGITTFGFEVWFVTGA